MRARLAHFLLLAASTALLVVGARLDSPGADADEEELQLTSAAEFGSRHHNKHNQLFPYETLARGRAHGQPVDPFAFTFEDYLREASSHSAADHPSEGRPHQPEGLRRPTSEQAASSAAKLNRGGARDEPAQRPDEDTDVSLDSGNEIALNGSEAPAKQQSAAPAAVSITGGGRAPSAGSSSNYSNANNDHNDHNNNDNDNNNHRKPVEQQSIVDEIKLLFGWKALPTQRCSRPCGRGFRLNHLSCLDLKFAVRVEDELCAKAQLIKPNELSDEPCNELDCEPEWISLEYQQQQCNLISTPTSEAGPERNEFQCKPKLFKRAQCAMLDRLGQTVHLEESRCNGTARGGAADDDSESSLDLLPSGPVGDPRTSNEIAPAEPDEIVDLPNRELRHQPDNELQLLAHRLEPPAHPPRHRHRHEPASGGEHQPPSSEPFLVAGEWSECVEGAARCGQLGRRFRNVTCRLYLAKSLRFVEMPASSCSSVAPLHREEPCYIDCGGSAAPAASSVGEPTETRGRAPPDNSLATAAPAEDEETLLDASMARYVWQHNRWTECDAKCLGGQMESVVECYDKVTGLPASSASLCEPASKPRPVVETCNEVPCAPEWRLEPWSNCSRRCGSAGVRSRSAVCVQLVPLESGDTDYMLVANELCQQRQPRQPPHKLEPCNRFDCPPEWHLGPWSECGRGCGAGQRNRTVACLREFARREGPAADEPTSLSAELAEAVQLASLEWRPGKATQVPAHECFKAHGHVPHVSEPCSAGPCAAEQATSAPFIDSDPLQNYRQFRDGFKRRTVTLKVGGRAQLIEGRNVKIRCRVVGLARRPANVAAESNSTSQAAAARPGKPDWRKDGVQIFGAANATVAEMRPLESPAASETDNNSILGNDVLHLNSNDDRLMADQPADQRPTASRLSVARRPGRARSLSTRSNAPDEDQQQQVRPAFQFVGQLGGRFSLVKENALRIKRLRPEDSGVYSCSIGALSESIVIQVVSRRQLADAARPAASNNYYAA